MWNVADLDSIGVDSSYSGTDSELDEVACENKLENSHKSFFQCQIILLLLMEF